MRRETKIFGIEISTDNISEPLKMVFVGKDKEEVLGIVSRRCDKCRYLKNHIQQISICELSNYSCHVELIGADYEIIYWAYGIYPDYPGMGIELMVKENIDIYQKLYNFDLYKFVIPYYMFTFIKNDEDIDEDKGTNGTLIFTYDVNKKHIVHPKAKCFKCPYKQTSSGIKSPCNPLYSAMAINCTYDDSKEYKLGKMQEFINKLKSLLYFNWR